MAADQFGNGNQGLINENPQVYATENTCIIEDTPLTLRDFLENRVECDEDELDPITSTEIFERIRHINDPEHPLTLEQLAVVQPAHIEITKPFENCPYEQVLVEFTPTIPHCSMATLIGLSLRVKLLRSLPKRMKIQVRIRAGTHQSEEAINKQLNDKERVAAALENKHLLDVVHQCLANSDTDPVSIGK